LILMQSKSSPSTISSFKNELASYPSGWLIMLIAQTGEQVGV
jgi:hypothetical protein